MVVRQYKSTDGRFEGPRSWGSRSRALSWSVSIKCVLCDTDGSFREGPLEGTARFERAPIEGQIAGLRSRPVVVRQYKSTDGSFRGAPIEGRSRGSARALVVVRASGVTAAASNFNQRCASSSELEVGPCRDDVSTGAFALTSRPMRGNSAHN